MRLRFVWPWATLFLWACLGGEDPAVGQPLTLTLDQALATARDAGVGAALARGRVEEARARRLRAARRFQENPVLEVDGGYRRADESFFDYAVDVTQGLESGARRKARLDGADAGVERAEAEAGEARRLLLREVALVFSRAVAARERGVLFARGRKVAEEILAATDRRYEAGEATALEWNRARTAAARSRADEQAAEAERGAALAELKGLLGRDPGEEIEVQGDLAVLPLEAEALLAGIDRRPDLLALAAELREAEAQILLGKALRRPALGVRGGYEREEGADVVSAGVAISLPVHDRGEETLAVGQARADALRLAQAAARRIAEAEVRGAAASLDRRLAAIRELETTALPALDDNETLALRSFEAGELDLGELLLIRQEILETRLSYLDRLLDAALARLELQAAGGAL